MNIAISVDVVLLERVLIVLSIRQDMRVETRVLERTVPHAFIKVLAWNGSEGILVLLDHLILKFSIINHSGAWDDKITVGSANRTCSVVLLLDLLVVSGSPVSNTLQTECMAASL